jgi:hypothetical protein
MAAEGSPAVQMVLPMAEMARRLRRGAGEQTRQAGLQPFLLRVAFWE